MAIAQREEHQARLAHHRADLVEERAGEIGLAPFARTGVLVEMPHRVPVGRGDLAPAQSEDVEAHDRRRAFLADRLALAAGEGVEEGVEIFIIAVVPVILQPVALDPPARHRRRDLARGAEGDVRRRQLVLHRDRFKRGKKGGRLVAEQAAARAGRERHGHLQLGIISPAGPLPRLGPAVIEHIFALTVGLQIGRGGTDRAAALLDHHRQRAPAALAPDAARGFEQSEEAMRQKWVVSTGEFVPLGGIDIAHGAGDARGEVGLTVGHRLPRSRHRHWPAQARGRRGSARSRCRPALWCARRRPKEDRSHRHRRRGRRDRRASSRSNA